MTPETLQRMRVAAEEATPGPWAQDYANPEMVVRTHETGLTYVCDCEPGYMQRSNDDVRSSADARFIALASPANVLALLDEVERWRGLFGEETHS